VTEIERRSDHPGPSGQIIQYLVELYYLLLQSTHTKTRWFNTIISVSQTLVGSLGNSSTALVWAPSRAEVIWQLCWSLWPRMSLRDMVFYFSLLHMVAEMFQVGKSGRFRLLDPGSELVQSPF